MLQSLTDPQLSSFFHELIEPLSNNLFQYLKVDEAFSSTINRIVIVGRMILEQDDSGSYDSTPAQLERNYTIKKKLTPFELEHVLSSFLKDQLKEGYQTVQGGSVYAVVDMIVSVLEVDDQANVRNGYRINMEFREKLNPMNTFSLKTSQLRKIYNEN